MVLASTRAFVAGGTMHSARLLLKADRGGLAGVRLYDLRHTIIIELLEMGLRITSRNRLRAGYRRGFSALLACANQRQAERPGRTCITSSRITPRSGRMTLRALAKKAPPPWIRLRHNPRHTRIGRSWRDTLNC